MVGQVVGNLLIYPVVGQVVGKLLIYRSLLRWQKRSIPSLKPLLFLRSTTEFIRRAVTAHRALFRTGVD